MRKISKIIVHCSATQEGKDISVDTIRKWHLKRGWRDIGYHFVISLDGEIEEGRPIEQSGAHTKGHNYENGLQKTPERHSKEKHLKKFYVP